MLPLCLINIISDYVNDGKYVLHNWVDKNKLELEELSDNPAAIHLIALSIKRAQELKRTNSEVCWRYLSANPAAIHLIALSLKRAQELKKYNNRVNWNFLSANPAIFYFKRLDRYDKALKEI